MVYLIDQFNRAVVALFDGLLFPFGRLPPIWGLTFISLLTGVVMVWIFGRISNQEAIRRLRSRIAGNLIGVRLFQGSVPVMLRLQGAILRDTLSYMRYSLVPMLIMFVPILLVLFQLQLRYSVRPLHPGERTLLKASMLGPDFMGRKVRLEAPPGIRVETPPVRVETDREILWRLRAEGPGNYPLLFHVGDVVVEKRLRVGSPNGAVCDYRSGGGAWDLLIHPGESAIPAQAQIKSLEIRYPQLRLSLLGWDVNWLAFFFVVSLLFGFSVKGLLGVEV